MTPFQLADLAEKTGFTEVAALIRSGTAEAGELYSFVMTNILDKMPKVEQATSSSETVVWGKEASYSGMKRIDGRASDGTRFRLEKMKARNYWDLAVSNGWGGGKTPTEKWVDLLHGEKAPLKMWVDQIMSFHDRPDDKAAWPAWLNPIVEAESYSIQRGQLNFSPEERKAGKSAIHAALMVYNKAMETVEVRRFIGKDARTPIEVIIPSGLTQGNFVVPRTAITWGPVANEAPLDKVLGSAFIEVDIVKAKLPTKWEPFGQEAAVLTVQSFDGWDSVEIGVNAKWLAGIVGAVAGKTGSARYFATAAKRGDPQPLSPLLVVGPDGTGAVIMPLRID